MIVDAKSVSVAVLVGALFAALLTALLTACPESGDDRGPVIGRTIGEGWSIESEAVAVYDGFSADGFLPLDRSTPTMMVSYVSIGDCVVFHEVTICRRDAEMIVTIPMEAIP